MSVVTGDIKQYQAATMPTSLTTSSVGGAINTGVQITGGTIGEIFPGMASAASGGGTRTIYAKTFVKNTNGADDLSSTVFFLANSLDDKPSGNHTVSVVSSSASDGSTKKARFIGLSSGGAPQQEEVTMNGTTVVTTTNTYSAIHRIEIRLVASGDLTDATGDITVSSNSTTIGVIPAGMSSATGEVKIGLVATLDGTSTTTDATTAPSGITFSKPRTAATGLAAANAGVLTHGTAQAVWWKWVVTEEQKPSADIELALDWQGETA